MVIWDGEDCIADVEKELIDQNVWDKVFKNRPNKIWQFYHYHFVKKCWIEDKGKLAEKALLNNDARTMYKIEWDLTGNTNVNTNVPEKSKNGQPLLTEFE